MGKLNTFDHDRPQRRRRDSNVWHQTQRIDGQGLTPGDFFAAAPVLWQNRFSMGLRLPRELLDELRTYLQHFDETGHLGETETVAEIKSRLRGRIAEVEAELRVRGESERSPNPQRAH